MMRNLRIAPIRLLLLAFVVAAPACATTGDGTGRSGEAAEGASSSTSRPYYTDLDSTLWMQSGAEYEASARQAWALARVSLDRALETPEWTASVEQKRAGGYRDKPPAVVVDVDETVLDNSAYQARLLLDGESFDPETWNAWCREEKAPAVPGALEFAQYAADKGVTILYVTNRDHAVEESTRDNLRKLGFPVDAEEDRILTKHEKEGWGSDKTSRRKAVARDYRILLLVGDNLGDFVGETEVAPAERSAKVRKWNERWGHHWIVLPNPTYGDWESGTFGYDFSLERREQVERKLDALESRRSGDDSGNGDGETAQ